MSDRSFRCRKPLMPTTVGSQYVMSLHDCKSSAPKNDVTERDGLNRDFGLGLDGSYLLATCKVTHE
ncbi:hypothetical protein TBK1r_43230 [Stieleria magnilauensis]|uniref:Uncharacterized protein n=1 Tax=Stieleria magnilauensis TaxID=2527963 RepID=A0ABX5XZW2_9BACT|nr:hypothetical protein TBK1r_43230 [Planctomycetes bacterium TBK1r]